MWLCWRTLSGRPHLGPFPIMGNAFGLCNAPATFEHIMGVVWDAMVAVFGLPR